MTRETEIRVRQVFHDVTFCRLLAKTAHCWAISGLGIDGFSPFFNNLISGADIESRYYFIGGASAVYSKPEQPFRIEGFRAILGSDQFVHVDIQLFADIDAPVYQVVVGKKF